MNVFDPKDLIILGRIRRYGRKLIDCELEKGADQIAWKFQSILDGASELPVAEKTKDTGREI